MSNSSNFIGGLLFGGLLGFIGGLLWAPKSGAELRKDIAETSDELYQQANEQISELKDLTETALSDMQRQSQDVIRKASDTMLGTKETLKSKIDEITGQGTRALVEEIE